VQTLQSSGVSATRAFERFDGDGDGCLSRAEFADALAACGVPELPRKDVDLLMASMDADGDGRIQYTEFARKLERCGLKTLSAAETGVRTIFKALRRLVEQGAMTQARLFRLIHKEGDGLLTREDFRDTLTSTLNGLAMAEVSAEDVENFIEYFYRDEQGGIDLASFKRIFDRFQAKMDEEDALASGSPWERKRAAASRRVLELK
jgi:Ca2+-binding EF-hand superfamily protein